MSRLHEAWLSESRIRWQPPIALTYTEFHMGSLGRHDVVRIDSNRARDSWKLDLKVPGFKTGAVVRYGSLEEAKVAAAELLERWMRDVGMMWAPRREQVRSWTRVGVQYDGLTKGEVRLYKNEDMARAALAQDAVGLFENGRVVRQVIDEIVHDWKPVTP